MRTRRRPALVAGVTLALVAVSAGAADDDVPPWFGAPAGGVATVTVDSPNAFAQPAPVLATADLRRFTFGNRVFNTKWVAAPASVDGFDGLGPVFNRVSCSSCHTRDGRGQPPREESSPLESMLIRLSGPGLAAPGGPKPLPAHGDQVDAQAM